MTLRSDKIPLIECYGPVFQGEGPLAGTQTIFVRVGACDYLCKKCDSLHAVLPEHIAKMPVMSASHIGDIIQAQILIARENVRWITISGGNPALWDLRPMMHTVWDRYPLQSFAVETQGSRWADWITLCESVSVSPKGPGMIDDAYERLQDLREFLKELASRHVGAFIKIPILCAEDLKFASEVACIPEVSSYPIYLSVGNKQPYGGDISDVRRQVLEWAAEVEELVLKEPMLSRARVFPQLHVLVHGNAKLR